jgi:hypothetical protein
MNRGLASTSAIQPWKSAAKQVFTRVEGTESFGNVDVQALDVDEYLERFVTKSRGEYKPDSLNAYANRFRKAVEAYRGYLADPMGWRPKLRASPRRAGETGTNGRTRSEAPAPASPTSMAAPASGSPPPAAPSLTDYPFPLRSGQMAHLYLPSPLDKDDADRLTQFLRALVFERPAQLSSGESDEQ